MISARKDDVVDVYHGVPVADPYRWLEQPDSAETLAWVKQQNASTAAYLAAIPAREVIRKRLTDLWDFPRYSTPTVEGGRYFFLKNDGLQNQAVFCVLDRLDGDPRPVLDPNLWSTDGTVALSSASVSHDGRLVAYAISERGSDWQEIRIRSVGAEEDLPDTIRWCKFAGIAWRHDSSGFFYNRYPEPGSVSPGDESCFNRVYWHALGTDQADDRLVYERPEEKELGYTPSITDDGRYLLLHVWRGTDPVNRFYIRPVDSDEPFIRLLDRADARYEFIDNVDSVFYFQTDLKAPRGKIIAIDLDRPGSDDWQEILAEGPYPIDFVVTAGDALVVVTMRDAQHRVTLYDLNGQHIRDLTLPTIGSVAGLNGRRGRNELLLGFTSFLFPTTIFRCELPNGELVPLRASEVDFDPARYVTRQLFASSRDGTRVPVFLTHRKDLRADETSPTLLYGYGGFKVSLTPSFSVSMLAWLERGGVYAVANIRGGGEYGEEWHRSGTLERKQNVFDDFIACAEYLVESGVTTPHRLAIMGGSNGGLLVAACLVQRPDLFGAVVCQVPVADMLRYHRFTVGRFWTGEYGDAEKDAERFRFLMAYSPLHNVRPGVRYPPVLITSADTDDRVVPAHAKKLAAALQEAQAGEAPILLRVELKAGHGAGKPMWKVIEEQADVLAFLTANVGG